MKRFKNILKILGIVIIFALLAYLVGYLATGADGTRPYVTPSVTPEVTDISQ